MCGFCSGWDVVSPVAALMSFNCRCTNEGEEAACARGHDERQKAASAATAATALVQRETCFQVLFAGSERCAAAPGAHCAELPDDGDDDGNDDQTLITG